MSDSKITNLQIVILNIGEFAFVEIHEYSENVDIISMSDEFKGFFTLIFICNHINMHIFSQKLIGYFYSFFILGLFISQQRNMILPKGF